MTVLDIAVFCLALLNAAVGAGVPPRRDSALPLLDRRSIVGLVPDGEGFDAYWVHQDQLATPVHTTLLKTAMTGEGSVRGAATVMVDREGYEVITVDGGRPAVQALWTARGTLLASPIVNGTLRYPGGKFIAAFVDNPLLSCHRSQCMASWPAAGGRMAVVLDSDSNTLSAPFFLPNAWVPLSLTLGDSGILYVRRTSDATRAALISRNGSIEYEVSMPNGQLVAVAPANSGYMVAYTERSALSSDLRAFTISDSGVPTAPVTLLHDVASAAVVSMAVAWNGTSYLMAIERYGSDRGTFVMRFSADLAPLDPAPRPTGIVIGIPFVRVFGTSFVVGWNGGIPYVTVVSADGRLSPPTPVDALAGRRRVVGH